MLICVHLWLKHVFLPGLRRLTGLRLPRVLMAVLLSLPFQVAVVIALYLLGLVPKDILKTLIYA